LFPEYISLVVGLGPHQAQPGIGYRSIAIIDKAVLGVGGYGSQ
jgi:hypothetical protein